MTAPQGWGAPQQFAPQQYQQPAGPALGVSAGPTAPAPQQNVGAPGAQVVDPFNPIPAIGGGGLPTARHLEGRVVIIQPLRIDENAAGFNKGEIKPTAICDIIVVDGGPIVYGDRVSNSGQQLAPPTRRVETPARFTGWLDSHKWIVDPLREMLRAGQPLTVGIIEKGDKGNQPYFLTETHTDINRKPRTDPSYAQRRQNAINLWNAFQAGQWQPPTPVELNPQPAAAPAAPAAQPQAWGSPQAGAAPLAWAQQGQQPPTAVTQGWVAQQPAVVAPAAPMMPDLSRPVPGYESVWAQANEEQRRQAWQHYMQQNGGQQPQAAPQQAAGQGWPQQGAPGAPVGPPPATPWG